MQSRKLYSEPCLMQSFPRKPFAPNLASLKSLQAFHQKQAQAVCASMLVRDILRILYRCSYTTLKEAHTFYSPLTDHLGETKGSRDQPTPVDCLTKRFQHHDQQFPFDLGLPSTVFSLQSLLCHATVPTMQPNQALGPSSFLQSVSSVLDLQL
ncbi:hypothetical protein Hanom_Chr12g01076181 [Helianthus anomalus]